MTETEVLKIRPGTVLSNGTTVVALREEHRGYVVVLCLRTDEDVVDRYVTWSVDPTDGSAYWGHYFDDITEAVADFVER